MNNAHQRKGAKSNSHVGSGFEALARRWFLEKGIPLNKQFPLGIGRGEKAHYFDLGSENDNIIVECKSHTWTEGGNVPSAKMKAWNEAMYYFHLASEWYQKVFFVKRSIRPQTGQSLLDYYLKTFRCLIPPDVHFIEYDEDLEKSFGYEGMKIESASLDEGVVVIDGHRFGPGEKYTILEQGWAVYLAPNIPQEWMDRYGETKLQDRGSNELDSKNDLFITSHPVLVALALQFWWHANGRPIKTAPIVRVPDFDEAVEIVRNREILNGFNEPYARIVPGEPRWRLRNLLSGM